MEYGQRKGIKTFKKCDLHVHSSSDYSRKYSEKELIDALLAADLDVIAITDHNIVDVDLYTRVSNAVKSKGMTVLPGVELNVRLDKATIDYYNLTVAGGAKGHYFHGIIWCAPEDLHKLEYAVRNLMMREDLENNLPPVWTKDDLNEFETHKLTYRNLSKKSEGRSVTLKDIQAELEHIRHFFVFHENKGDRSLSDYLPNQTESGGFIKENDAFKDRLYYYNSTIAIEGKRQNKRVQTDQAMLRETTLSCLFFSDPKRVEDIGSKYTWIDFDGDIDSLLLAITDPEGRIVAGYENAHFPQRNTSDFLESVEFDLYENGGREHVSLSFAPGLNGIVGARGSGKSMLAHILDKSVEDGYRSLVDPSSIRYKLIDGSATSNVPRHLYLSQGELSAIFENDDYRKVPFIRDRLKAIEEEATAESEKAYREICRLLRLQQKAIVAFLEKYQSGAQHPDCLVRERPSGITIARLPDKEQEQLQFTRALDVLSELKIALTKASEQARNVRFIVSHKETKRLCVAAKQEVESIGIEIESLLSRVNTVSKAVESVEQNALVTTRDELMDLLKSTAEKCNSRAGSNARRIYNEEMRQSLEYIVDLLRLRRGLLGSTAMIEETFTRMLAPIKPKEYDLGDAGNVTVKISYTGVASYEERFNQRLSGNGIKKGDVLARVCLLGQDMTEILSFFDQRKFRSSDYRTPDTIINGFFDTLIDEIKQDMERKVSIAFNGMSLDDMSPGTQAHALLNLFLHTKTIDEGYNYIILDQPEDNLDTNTIGQYLVDRIKELKLQVQIFVVSHSAPVIINGDARTVTLCEEKEGRISYTTGSINGKPIKQRIASVLDGGERYLKMRLYKYNFQLEDYLA